MMKSMRMIWAGHVARMFYTRGHEFWRHLVLPIMRRSGVHGHLSKSECSVATSCP
jgi:hypothetical protein